MPNPDNEVVGEYKEKIDKITKLGDKKTLSKEVIVSYEPDIIIGRASMFSSSSMGTYEELNKYGINIFTQSASLSNTNINSVVSDIRALGKIFNVESRAEEVAKTIENKILEATKDIEQITSYKNALIMYNFNGTTFGAYKSALQEHMLNTLGYTNVATGSSGLSLENLVNMNPELIIYVTADRNKVNDSKEDIKYSTESIVIGIINKSVYKQNELLNKKNAFVIYGGDIEKFLISTMHTIEEFKIIA